MNLAQSDQDTKQEGLFLDFACRQGGLADCVPVAAMYEMSFVKKGSPGFTQITVVVVADAPGDDVGGGGFC